MACGAISESFPVLDAETWSRAAHGRRQPKDVNQSRRLLSLAAVWDGMDRGAAAKIGAWTARRCATGSIASTLRA